MARYCNNIDYSMNRRDFLGRFALGIGGAALTTLLNRDAAAAAPSPDHPRRVSFQAGTHVGYRFDAH